jgi:hypothetical protein
MHRDSLGDKAMFGLHALFNAASAEMACVTPMSREITEVAVPCQGPRFQSWQGGKRTPKCPLLSCQGTSLHTVEQVRDPWVLVMTVVILPSQLQGRRGGFESQADLV